MSTAALPILRLGNREYPVVLPSLRDPRLHLAAVIISIHVLGQTALGFDVSVPQILVAILACAVIEVVLTLRKTGRLVWPASAMLTGSGVALIFRVIGTEPGDHWTWYGWHLFAIVAAVSLATKYLIKYRGSHVFNPSNVGLVAAFLVLGSSRVEPLDFWWAPFHGWMVVAYAIILGGGLIITGRLRLLAMAATFWVTLAAGLGVLASSGHCMTTRWSLEPVCGSHFWWVILTSPEVLIFLFFMITDPKTIPAAPQGRVAFAMCIAALGTLLVAPQATEFGAKVGLLAGLALMSPLRPIFDRLFSEAPAPGVVNRLTTSGGAAIAARRIFSRGAFVGALPVVLAAAIVVAGIPAREAAQAVSSVAAPVVAVEVDPATVPPLSAGDDFTALNSDLTPDELGLVLAENLEIERRAGLSGDLGLLLAADSGVRLAAMEQRIDDASADGERRVLEYTLASLHLTVEYPEGEQLGPSLAFTATGSVDDVRYGSDGAELDRATAPLDSTFIMRQMGDGWRITDELPEG